MPPPPPRTDHGPLGWGQMGPGQPLAMGRMRGTGVTGHALGVIIGVCVRAKKAD